MKFLSVWTGSRAGGDIRLEDMQPVGMRSALLEWRRARGRQVLPSAAQMDWSALKDVAGNLSIVDMTLGGPAHAVYALSGPNLDRLFGRPLAGRPLRDCYTGFVLSEVLSAYARAGRTRQPLHTVREFRVLGRSFSYRRLILPLAVTAGSDTAGYAVLVLYPDGALTDAHEWRAPAEEAALLDLLQNSPDLFGRSVGPGIAI